MLTFSTRLIGQRAFIFFFTTEISDKDLEIAATDSVPTCL